MSRAEKVILTNMCMIYDDAGKILVQNRSNKNWPGITFPGGHIEKNEAFHDAVIREVKEETGLTIKNPILCGTKQFQTTSDERYIVLFYKTNLFFGELVSSSEGEIFWIKRKELLQYPLAPDFEEMLAIFESDTKSEFYYQTTEDGVEIKLF
ncbi:8-oxo-dGTP diphosphatase [Isobaculum melis]|uniref:8-oxo-dGTP diphosphatase n=1 Tax=Isobaculum melis TaxID=142588 RepID=A0A1H9SZ25_9LACT|nr:8-oxo-dGTP diphosphatase [Isobaculum melis]SER90262.1 8-oxo-dGTP diphosphatase [Isobaculum melis]